MPEVTWQSNYVPGCGNPKAKLMFVGEAPGSKEDEKGIPFCGPSGQFLFSEGSYDAEGICGDIGIKRNDVYITNVLKYRPPGNNIRRYEETGHTVEEGIDQLWEEIRGIDPNCIVAFGNFALWALTGRGTGYKGITEWRGSILKTRAGYNDYKVVPTIHPAAFLHSQGERNADTKGGLDWKFKYISTMDIARALEESKTREYDIPNRNLEVCTDYARLQQFIDTYYKPNGDNILSVDIEVVKSIPICIGLAFNDWHGISVPLLDILSWENLDGIPAHNLAIIWKLLGWLFARPDIKVIGQNFKFDHTSLENICGIRINNFWADIMIMAHNLYPEFPKRLAFHTSVWTREPYYKDDGKEFNLKKESVRKFMQYNARDAVVTWELYQHFLKESKALVVPGFPNWHQDFVQDYTMKLHKFYMDIESVGMLTNEKLRKELIIEYKEKIANSQERLDSIAGRHINVQAHGGKNPPVKTLLCDDFKLPKRASYDEDSLVALMANRAKLPEHRRAIELILEIRRQRKALGTYFEARPDFDGRMRTNFRICGTETGRSSTGILKPPVRPIKIGLGFHQLTKHGEIGPEIRSEFEADEGYVIVETDMSQAEARIVAILGNDVKTLDFFARKADIHRLTASWIFGIPPEQITTELRFIGKTTRHAGNYDMGKRRLMEIVNTDAKKFHLNISISEYKAGKILDAFHNFSPAIRGTFHPSIQEALEKNNRILVNPFGRHREFFGQWSKDLFKEAYAHLPQSTVPDHLRRAGLRALARFKYDEVNLTKFRTPFIIEAHDAFIGLIKKEYVDYYIKVMHEEIEVPIDFSRCTIQRGNLVIPAESKIGTNYKECKVKGCAGCKHLHEYKLPKAA